MAALWVEPPVLNSKRWYGECYAPRKLPDTPMQNGTRLAALDLGSNSFRLEIGRYDHGQIRRSEYLKETVRQGNGLDADRNLSAEAMQRGWDCLARFAERLAGFERGQIRAVATQTLREARNRDVFLARAHEILGFPIDVIPGREEARLIYQGVTHLLPQSEERRLVIDIGGRSTELILGQGYEAKTMESYRVGSVVWSMKYFAQGQLNTEAFRIAEIAAQAVLDEAQSLYRADTWDVAYGASGTVGAVADVLEAAGWPTGIITQEGLDWLLDRLVRAQHVDRLKVVGIKDDRRDVIGGGISVLRALFSLLGIREMHAAQGALRHGVLYDLLDREDVQTDIRSTTVGRLASKFDTDTAQATRVSKTALHFFRQLQEHSTSPDVERQTRKLDWAARLHEIGSLISHGDYHRHGAYILDHADAPGFAQAELHRLSQLVLGHRGKLKKLDVNFSDHLFVRQLLSLRLAVLLCHARRDPELKGLTLTSSNPNANEFTLVCRTGWVREFPQSAHLLAEEVGAWQKVGITLALKGC